MKHLGSAELIAIVDREAEPGLGQIATQGVESLATRVEALTLGGEAGPRALADEDEDTVAPGDEQWHQMAADESGRTGDEVGHAADNSFLRQSEMKQCLSQSSSPSAGPPSDAR
jgi:hypothetical protein